MLWVRTGCAAGEAIEWMVAKLPSLVERCRRFTAYASEFYYTQAMSMRGSYTACSVWARQPEIDAEFLPKKLVAVDTAEFNDRTGSIQDGCLQQYGVVK